MTPPVLELWGVSKSYGALRPLRIEELRVEDGESVALIGLDQPAAETFISLVTGASLPDRGDVRVFGRLTSDIADSADWLANLDRFGIVSDRGALLEGLTIIQNLALPYSLDVEPPPADIRLKAIGLAQEVEIPEGLWEHRAADLSGAVRSRVRVGRALALRPSLLLVEHPTASVASTETRRIARTVRAVADRRRIAIMTLTSDRQFASAASSRVLILEPATGRATLASPKGHGR